MKINKLKDILITILTFFANKLGFVLTPIKDVEVEHKEVSEPEPSKEGCETSHQLFEDQENKFKRIFEIMDRIKQHKFEIEYDFGEPTQREKDDETIKINQIIQKLETGEYETGFLRKAIHRMDERKLNKQGVVKHDVDFDIPTLSKISDKTKTYEK